MANLSTDRGPIPGDDVDPLAGDQDMQYLKTFNNGQRLEWQIEPGVLDHPSPIAYIDGQKAGHISPCMNMDSDGNKQAPKVVNGKTLVAYIKHRGNVYWLVDREYDAVRDAQQAAIAAKRKRDSDAWISSDHGKAEIERRRKEREWDAINNEGGDGYNPYRREDAVTGSAFDPRERHNPEGA